MNTYSKADYQMLIVLAHEECTTEFKSYTKKKISELTNLSISKISKTLPKFIEDGYVKEGAYQKHSKTYFVIEEGLEKIKLLVG